MPRELEIQWLTGLIKPKSDVSIREKIWVTPSQDAMFEGEWAGSVKEPDLTIASSEEVGGYNPDTFVEVGVSNPLRVYLTFESFT